MKGTNRRFTSSFIALSFITAALTLAPAHGPAQQAAPAAPLTPKPAIEEWVYRTKYGFKDEWWTLFKKDQIAVPRTAEAAWLRQGFHRLRSKPPYQ